MTEVSNCRKRDLARRAQEDLRRCLEAIKPTTIEGGLSPVKPPQDERIGKKQVHGPIKTTGGRARKREGAIKGSRRALRKSLPYLGESRRDTQPSLARQHGFSMLARSFSKRRHELCHGFEQRDTEGAKDRPGEQGTLQPRQFEQALVYKHGSLARRWRKSPCLMRLPDCQAQPVLLPKANVEVYSWKQCWPKPPLLLIDQW